VKAGLPELAKMLLLLWFLTRGCLSMLVILVSRGEQTITLDYRMPALWLAIETTAVLVLLGVAGVTK
jgi:hypothetical protein